MTNPCQTCVHQHLQERGSFPSVNHCAECQVQRNVEEDENIIDMVQRSPHTSIRRISVRSCVPCMIVWRTWHAEGMYPYHIQCLQSTCVAGWNCAVGLILTPIWFITFCSLTRPILPAMESTIQETSIYGIVIVLMELSKATTNITFL